MKLKNSNCDKTHNLNGDKTQIVTKLKLWVEEKTQSLKFDKTQIVTRLKNSNCVKN